MPSLTEIPLILGELLVLLVKLLFFFLEACYRLVVPPSRKDVAGKVVLITGAGHGMGRCTAKRFAKLQARVVIWDINEAGNSRTVKEIQSSGGEVYAYTVDVTKKEKVYEAAEKVKKDVGKVDILINNAGILVGELLLELTDDQIQRVMNVNVMAHFWTIRAFLPDMLSANEGHLVAISSAAGYFGKNFLVDYSASKFAVTGMDESLELELMKNYDNANIKLTIVHPYIVKTGLVHGYTSRFMPILEEDDAADTIVDGILRNRRKVFIPSDLRLSVVFKYIMPHKSYLALADFFKSETCSQGKQD
ncbi:short-chain dehydrogenase/reductase family 16C member 6-like isoform X2 [Apostichopus japonicus]